jgi:excisionase family DNA binding protein
MLDSKKIPEVVCMEYLTTQQSAEILGVSRQRILILIAQKRLSAQKMGRDWMIKPSDLEAFVRRPQGNYHLTPNQIQEIQQKAKAGVPVKDLALDYNVSVRTIYRYIHE